MQVQVQVQGARGQGARWAEMIRTIIGPSVVCSRRVLPQDTKELRIAGATANFVTQLRSKAVKVKPDSTTCTT